MEMNEDPLPPTPEEARKSFREALTDYVSKGWTSQSSWPILSSTRS